VKIIVTQTVPPGALARLQQAQGDEIVVVDREGKAVDDGDLSDGEVFMRWWSPRSASEAVLQQAPQLKWMHTPSAGLDQVLFPALVDSDVMLTNSSGVHAIPISEWVILYILAAAKRLPELLAAQREHRWQRDIKLQELSDKTLLILGYGAIGQAVAKRAAPLLGRVIAARSGNNSKDEGDTLAGVELTYGSEAWKAAVPIADFVAVCLPLTAQTQGIFDAATIATMKAGAWFINIARGDIADEDALLRALQEGHIAGAGLDAFSDEPLPADHPLYSLPESKVILTPHISWNSPLIENRTLDLFLENLCRYKAGEALLNVVDKQKGY
jgi:phosphoglycerate dehydrogenase-like enzyme